MQVFAFFCTIKLCFRLSTLSYQLSTINYIRSLSSVISGGEKLKNITIFFAE